MDTRELGVQCREVPALSAAQTQALARYRAQWKKHCL